MKIEDPPSSGGLKAESLKKDGRRRKDPPSPYTAGLWRGTHGASGRKGKRLEDQKLRRFEGEQVEGFRFGEFSWSIFNS